MVHPPLVEPFVVAGSPGTRGGFLLARTLRRLAELGGPAARVVSRDALHDALRERREPVWILSAGAVPLGHAHPRVLPKSATGLPLAVLGRVGSLEGAAETSGDPAGAAHDLASSERLPSLESVYLEDPARLLARGDGDLPERLGRAIATRSVRAFMLRELDVACDDRLRVLEVVTTLHRGGAERLALDLTRELGRLEATVALAVTSRPVRTTFPVPEGAHLLYETGERLGDLARRLAIDVAHAHLLGEPALRELHAAVPTVASMHNARIGWPPGVESAPASLVLGCSHGVSADAMAHLSVPVRTVWNGITPREATKGARARLRALRGFTDASRVFLAVANVRPQKNLPELVQVLAELREQGHDARLVLAGEPVARNAASLSEEARLARAVETFGVEAYVHRLGATEDVEDEYAACDVVVSASVHEGLSLVHLEALAAGRPVVARDVFGLEELDARHPGRITRVPQAAPPSELARAWLRAANRRDHTPREAPLAPDFTTTTMARTTRALLERAASTRAATARGPGVPRSPRLVLVTNNLVTGGAQSSARRLLVELGRRGHDVGCVTVEEQPEYPSPGSRTLAERVPVFHAPSVRTGDPRRTAEAVARFVDRHDGDREPTVVVLWNVIAEVKALLGELLLREPLFDVSPGEMYFASLERYFAKPRPGLALDTPARYGARLSSAVVKYEAEVARARSTLGAPVTIVRNGVPLPPLAPRHARRGHVVLGTAARLSPDKRLDDLVDAFRAACASPDAPRLELRVAGGPERGHEAYREALEQRARGLPVRFVGELPSVDDFLHDLDAFVMVSEPSGCPNATLEAMAKGLAVVATSVGGTVEQIVDGESGLLVPRRDVEALTAGMLALARDHDGLRARLGRAARERIERHFSVGRMADDYARLFGLGG